MLNLPKTILLKIFNSLDYYNAISKSIVTIGTFDGVHIGHKKILSRVVQESEKMNCQSIVLSFFPHPRMVLQQNSDIKLLNTIDEKIKLIGLSGIDNLIIHPFSKEFSNLTAEEFVKSILVEKLNVCKIIIGYDHRFGKNRTANIDDLIEFSKKYNFEVEQIDVQSLNEINISSTKIRNALTDGKITLANKYLSYNYSISGTVENGKQLGRTIGFPTANLALDESYKLLPKNGVYVVQSIIENKIVFGMMNIGTRPTLDGKNQTIEVHFLDFENDLYSQNLTVEILSFIREEQKFNSLDELKLQIEKDKIFTQKIIQKII